MDEILTDINLILATGEYLFSGVILGFDKGRRKDSAPLKLSGMDDVFKIKYTGVERNMLQNFNAECFTVAGILNYRMQEKLKELASNIMKGRTGEQVSRGEENVDPQKLFIERAKGLLDMYQYTGDTPPDGHLKTNYRTATTSAYHGSLWKKMEAAGIYVALQYKTRKDKKVRPEHKKLDDLIYYKDDPIWKIIYPPNSWNCRCYTTPLTIDEIKGKEVQNPVRDADEEKKIITEAGISKEFARNPGMSESIYNKWMDTEIEAVNFSAWFKKAFDYDRSVTKLLTKENLEQILEDNAVAPNYIEPTKENWDKIFKDNQIETCLNNYPAILKNELKIKGKPGETFTAYEKFILKGKGDKVIPADNRHEFLGLIEPTMKDALLVLKDKGGAIVFLKSFKDSKGRIDFTAVSYKEGDFLEIISLHDRKRFDNLFEWFKSSEVLLFLASTSKKSGNFSRDTSPALPVGSEPNAKLPKTADKFNEVWSERKFSKKDDRYYSITRFITYGPDWFQVITVNGNKEGSRLERLDWNELDTQRAGMLCEQKGFDAWK